MVVNHFFPKSTELFPQSFGQIRIIIKKIMAIKLLLFFLSFLLYDKSIQQLPDMDCNDLGNVGDLGKEESFDLVRTCAMEFFYGPGGLNTKELYANYRNGMEPGTIPHKSREQKQRHITLKDMLLVMVSGELLCYKWPNDKPNVTIHLVQHHPRGSFFTNCYNTDKTLASIHLSGMAEQQPYIIAAIFAERRCWGLVSRDSYKMHYKGHKLVVEHNCGMPNDQQQRRRTKEMPFFFLFTEKFSNRMAEITLIIKLNDPEESLRHLEIIEGKKRCPTMPPDLKGREKIDRIFPSIGELNKNFYGIVGNGGFWKPPECVAQQRLAIIIPYRNREEHLRGLLNRLIPFLVHQQAEFRFFVINQAYPEGKPHDKFNRAKLLNAGILEIEKIYNSSYFDCLILTDVDLVPENEHNLYRCNYEIPKRLIWTRDKNNYEPFYETYFGGIVALTPEQYKQINGFSNYFWGWGGEDDDMSTRIRKGPNYERFESVPEEIGTFTDLDAGKLIDPTNRKNDDECIKRLLSNSMERMFHDGLKKVNYTLIQNTEHQLYRNISVDLLFAESIRAEDYPCHDLHDEQSFYKSIHLPQPLRIRNWRV